MIYINVFEFILGVDYCTHAFCIHIFSILNSRGTESGNITLAWLDVGE